MLLEFWKNSEKYLLLFLFDMWEVEQNILSLSVEREKETLYFVSIKFSQNTQQQMVRCILLLIY